LPEELEGSMNFSLSKCILELQLIYMMHS